MELAEINEGTVGKCLTSELGPLILKELKGGKKNRKQHIKATMAKLAAEMGPQHNRLFLVGGSWRAFAKIDMLRRDYPLHVMHEYRISLSSVKKTIKFIETSELEEIRKKCGITAARIELVPIACEILSRLVGSFKPKDIAISAMASEKDYYTKICHKSCETEILLLKLVISQRQKMPVCQVLETIFTNSYCHYFQDQAKS